MRNDTHASPHPFRRTALKLALLVLATVATAATILATDTRANSHLVYFQIWRIEAANKVIDTHPGARIQLRLDVFDKEGNTLNAEVDKTIQDDALFRWIGEGEFFEMRGIPEARKSGRPDDRVVDYIVSRNPGVYSVVAGLTMPDLCAPKHTAGCTGRATASFTIRAIRTPSVTATSSDPVDPPRPIPSQITDSDGNIYSVAIPSTGGEARATDASIEVPTAAVNNNTLIGIRISKQNLAINAEDAPRRYTVGGDWYQVDIVNSKGQPNFDYRLGVPATVCLPMPTRFRPYLSDVILVEGIGYSRILTSNPRFDQEYGWRACGATSSLPGTFAVAVRGDRSELLPPSPTPAPTEAPVIVISVGGNAPTSNAAALWAILGAIIIAAGIAMLAIPSMRRPKHRKQSIQDTTELAARISYSLQELDSRAYPPIFGRHTRRLPGSESIRRKLGLLANGRTGNHSRDR